KTSRTGAMATGVAWIRTMRGMVRLQRTAGGAGGRPPGSGGSLEQPDALGRDPRPDLAGRERPRPVRLGAQAAPGEPVLPPVAEIDAVGEVDLDAVLGRRVRDRDLLDPDHRPHGGAVLESPFLPDGAVERPAVALDHGGAVPAPAQAAVEDVVGAEEVRGEEAARLAIDGEGIAGLHDFAVPQQND